MERLNKDELEFAHHLEYLNCKLIILKQNGSVRENKMYWNRRFRRKKKVRVWSQKFSPVSLGYFTVLQWQQILHEVSHNYLLHTHLMMFDGLHFIIKVVPKDEPDSNEPIEILPTLP